MTLNLTAREREYLCVIADVKHENSELRDEIDRMKAEAVAADIRIENDALEFQRIYAVLRSHAEITQKAEAERDAAQADAKRYGFVLGMQSETLLRLYNTRLDLRQEFINAAMKGEQP